MIKTGDFIEQIKKHSNPFSQSEELLPIIQEASTAKYVLLGEASHGTSEFYTIRADITKQLIKEYGYSFIAVEGDWPACYEVNRFVKGMTTEYKDAKDLLNKCFQRWPHWMWANKEMVDLVDWLYSYNKALKGKKVGFYGIDIYSLWESLEAIVSYLEKKNSPYLQTAIDALQCFDPFERKPEKYGISAAFYGEDCMSEIIELLDSMQVKKKVNEKDTEADLNMKVNGIVARNGEFYYHTMVTHDNESWNIRDRHMVEVLQYISEFYGKNSKGIVWEHNTHIGDARATDMEREGMVNVGQLTRQQYGEQNVFAIGFGTYVGTVIAAPKWGASATVMRVPQGIEGSWEEAVHKAYSGNQFFLFTEENKKSFQKEIGHRAIGVVYDPRFEHYGNYVPTRISDRYDGFIHVEKTTALTPL